MVEAVALLGALLLLLDRRIPGPARERSVVAYFRARGGAQVGYVLIGVVGVLMTGLDAGPRASSLPVCSFSPSCLRHTGQQPRDAD